ncbi:pyruvate decarboxylase [Aspergillus ellipticus CBS 707.79]|uniref:Pyruvate decarboxylase n=1 Tax=Aspergillus ellipticus CBS 707.79 TaxID=1448320 RepID=A0A319DKM6_9EURO|nr:pyruvate decarboxylase [Aspergillus ellipticus CBS 707.79]
MFSKYLPQWRKRLSRLEPSEKTVPAKVEGGEVVRSAEKVDAPDLCISPRQPLRQPDFNQSQYNLGTYLAHRMEEIGVKDYFVVPGDYNLTLLDQILKNESLRMVGCCNELNAGYAADGYARASPARVAVVMVTFMVGGLSLINAIAGAYSDKLSVIVVSGCPSTKSLGEDRLIHHTLSTTDYDQALRMFREVTASSVRLDSARNASAVLDRTIIESLQRSLPVYIEIPQDMFTIPCARPTPLILEGPAPPKPEAIRALSDAFSRCWKRATRPVVIVGALARGIPQPLLMDFIARLGCPVLCQPDGKSLVSEDHEPFAGTLWSGASDPGVERLALESDLWVVIGGRWSDAHHWGKAVHNPRGSDRMIDLQNGYIGMPSGERIDGIPLSATLRTLIYSRITTKSTVAVESVNITKPTQSATPDPDTPLSMSTIVNGIKRLLKEKDTLIADAGDSWFNAQKVRLPPGADFQMQMIWGAIGWSLPATFGMQLARPDGRAVLMIGDGGFQMTAQELSTMIRAKANAIIFIINNLGYAIETAIHDGPYNYINNWDYAALGTCFSKRWHAVDGSNRFAAQEESANRLVPEVVSVRVHTAGELQAALERVERERDKLAVVECCVHPTDYSEGLRQFGAAFG